MIEKIIGVVIAWIAIFIFSIIIYYLKLAFMSDEKKAERRELKNRLSQLEHTKNAKELSHLIYDPYNNEIDLMNFYKFKEDFICFDDKHNIINIVIDSFKLWESYTLETVLKELKEQYKENLDIEIYLRLTKEIHKDSNIISKYKNESENKLKNEIFVRLLRTRIEAEKDIIKETEKQLENILQEYRKSNSVNEGNLSFLFIIENISTKEEYKDFIEKNKEVETDLKKLLKYEIMEDLYRTRRKQTLP